MALRRRVRPRADRVRGPRAVGPARHVLGRVGPRRGRAVSRGGARRGRGQLRRGACGPGAPSVELDLALDEAAGVETVCASGAQLRLDGQAGAAARGAIASLARRGQLEATCGDRRHRRLLRAPHPLALVGRGRTTPPTGATWPGTWSAASTIRRGQRAHDLARRRRPTRSPPARSSPTCSAVGGLRFAPEATLARRTENSAADPQRLPPAVRAHSPASCRAGSSSATASA